MKKLKSILIGSTNFKIIWDKNDYNSSFSYDEKLIIFGIKSKDNTQILEVVLHELIEILHCEQYTRHNNSSTINGFIFVYDHDRHTELCARLAGLLSLFLFKEGV